MIRRVQNDPPEALSQRIHEDPPYALSRRVGKDPPYIYSAPLTLSHSPPAPRPNFSPLAVVAPVT